MDMDFQSRLLGLLDSTAALYFLEAHPYYKRKGKWPLQLNLSVEAHGIFMWGVLRTTTGYLYLTPAFLWPVILHLCACKWTPHNGSLPHTGSSLCISPGHQEIFMHISAWTNRRFSRGLYISISMVSSSVCVRQNLWFIHDCIYSRESFPSLHRQSLFPSLHAPFGVLLLISYI